jgi:hypothetical protein
VVSMRIGVVNLRIGWGKSTGAVSLACEPAGIEIGARDRGSARTWLSWWMQISTVRHRDTGLAGDYWSATRRTFDGWMARIEAISVDSVIVDGSSRPGPASKAVMAASDLMFVPCPSSAPDLAATARTIKLIREVRAARADGGPTCPLIPMQRNSGDIARKMVREALREGDEPGGPAIHRRSTLADAARAQRWIGDYAPGGATHGDIEALAAHLRAMA